MNLRAYYQKIREIKQTLLEPFAVLSSHETADGGVPGVLTEVARHVAAKMIVEGHAQLASEEEAHAFREQKAEAKRLADQEAAANRMQITVVPMTDLRKPNRAAKESMH
jgi:hypothetical protein